MKELQRRVLELFRAKMLLKKAQTELYNPDYEYGVDDVLILLDSEINKLK